MKKIALNLQYHEGQNEVFFECQARKRVVAKGRRWGFTKGAAQFVVESMLNGAGPVLWGDTVTANIYAYFERYFLPVLSQLPAQIWDWKKQEKKLYIAKSVCDFRSADQPENWEGFGYRIVILNEAGIILKNYYLWNHSVRPMLMDYPDSICIIGGTPKGKNLFWELWKKGGLDPNWKSYQFSSYDNPFMPIAEIRELESDTPASVVRQEIHADFSSDAGQQVLIPYDLVEACMKKEGIDVISPEIWGLDVARHGDDYSALARRRGREVYEISAFDIHDTMQLASKISFLYHEAEKKPQKIFVETTGMGWGVHDRLRELGLPVYSADVGMSASMEKVCNMRAEMYVRLEREMKKGIRLPNDKQLLRQLSNVLFEYTPKAELKLVAKEKIKEEIGESPDKADAVALTYYLDVPSNIQTRIIEEVYEPMLAGVY